MKNDKKLKCKACKEPYDFRMHECDYSVQEYYGCKKCDNWCVKCKPDWNKDK